MPDDASVRRVPPGKLPVYRHLSSCLMFIGLGVLAFRSAETGLGVLGLLAAAVFLVLAVRWVLARPSE